MVDFRGRRRRLPGASSSDRNDLSNGVGNEMVPLAPRLCDGRAAAGRPVTCVDVRHRSRRASLTLVLASPFGVDITWRASGASLDS